MTEQQHIPELEGWPEFTLEPWGELGALCLRRGLRTFAEATFYVWKLPYRRTGNPHNFGSVIIEGCGTCCSKHTFIASLAREHGFETLQLEIVLYRMHAGNTPLIRPLLESHHIEAIPEAHCRLLFNEKTYDFTFASTTPNIPLEDILETHLAFPSQMPLLKEHLHKTIIAQWSQSHNLDPDVLWKLREACIEILERSFNR